MADVKALEYSTLKVPYEILNKKFRTAQKVVDREVTYVVNASNDLTCQLGQGTVRVQELACMLDGVVQKLQVLKRKACECLAQEEKCAKHMKARVEHIKGHANEQKSAAVLWKKKRVDRMLVDHFLRSGFYETASILARDSDIEDLVDIEVFLISHRVEEALSSHDSGPCLAWCYENKSKLRKLKSTLEFNVRVQEFIELIRNNQKLDAVVYARKHLASACTEGNLVPEIRKVMGLLAYNPYNVPPVYKHLFDLDRWTKLIEQFRQENFTLHQLNKQSVLSVTLQAGLSALKTPQCYQENHKSSECPVCSKTLNILASPLPFAHCAQSRIVCPITGHVMNENNHPMILPNGHVFGENALNAMATENEGVITCPKTKEHFRIEQAEKVFVM